MVHNLMRNYFLTVLATLFFANFSISDAIADKPTNKPDLPHNSDLTDKCHTSPLTQEKFLDMVHTIAMHGDLTDIPFIEKTLNTKFETQNLGKDIITYEISSYQGTQIKISEINYETSQEELNHLSGSMSLASISFYRVDKSSDSFHDCEYLRKDKIDKKFAPYRIEPEELDPKTIVGEILSPKAASEQRAAKKYNNNSDVKYYASGILKDVIGKYGSITDISYNFWKTSKVVTGITIHQSITKKSQAINH